MPEEEKKKADESHESDEKEDSLTTTDQEEAGLLDFTEAQQEFINKIASRTRRQARNVARKEYMEELAKKEADAEQKRMEEAGEYKALAEKYGARATELEPLVQVVSDYEAAFEELLEARVKELGKEAKTAIAALPEALDSLAKLRWLNANVGLFQSDDDGKKRPVGTPSSKARKKPVDPGKKEPAIRNVF